MIYIYSSKLSREQQRVMGWWPIEDIIFRLRIKGRFTKFSIISVHCYHSESTDDGKNAF